MKGSNVKKRQWAAVLYPESLPADWVEILQLSGLSIAISPLHDMDKNPDETPKKPHYHIVIVYGGPTTFSNVCSLVCDKLNAPIPIPLDSVRGYYRYLTHADNPEKAQYSPDGVVCLNGFNIADYVEMTRTEVLALQKRIIDFIRNLDIIEFNKLIEALADNDMQAELEVVMNHPYLFNTFVSSRRNEKRDAAAAALERSK